jgi:prepilin-type N-terminal cleavage/methylation domain-containing protein
MRPERAPDAGFTMIELAVTLAIMSIVMAMVTAGFVQLSAVQRLATAVSDAQAQVGRAFLRLDDDAGPRYAADLTTEMWSPSGSTHPSLLYVTTADGATCTALSLVGDRLQRQSWTLNPTTSPSAPEVLAVNVAAATEDGHPVEPFTVRSAAPKSADVTLAVAVAGTPASTRPRLRATYLAPNTVQGPSGVSLEECTST